MIEIDVKDRASKLAAHIVTTSFSLADSWANELKTLKNISFSSQSLTVTKFECVVFGHYYLRNIAIGKLSSSDQENFDRKITDTIIMALSLGCGSEENRTEAEHEASIRRTYLTFVEDRHPRYASQVYKGNKTVLDYFKFNLRENFNQLEELNTNIRFFTDTFTNKIKRFILNIIQKSQAQKWVLLNETIIFALADDFFSAIKDDAHL